MGGWCYDCNSQQWGQACTDTCEFILLSSLSCCYALLFVELILCYLSELKPPSWRGSLNAGASTGSKQREGGGCGTLLF